VCLRPLKNLINFSTVGVAVYDRNMHCRALNAALAAMDIVAFEEHAGKSIQEVFGTAAQELEPVFRRVLAAGHNFPDFLLPVPGRKGTRRWFVNFYPIKDESGRVWLVAATFSEITKRRSAALHLGHTAGLRRKDVDSEPSLLGEELCELLAHSLNLARRSVKLMDDSIALRLYVSETRMETGLEPLRLSLTATRTRQSLLRCVQLQPESTPWAADIPADSDNSGSVEGRLSLREGQVLNLLTAGKSNKEIGSALTISTRTVETYRARLMTKLKLHSTAELVRYAIRKKIIDPRFVYPVSDRPL
jgi:DNA-binding CsgD family transcriptional regulator